MLTAAEQKLNLVFRVTATAFGFLNTVGCIAFLILSLHIFKSSDSQRVEYAVSVYLYFAFKHLPNYYFSQDRSAHFLPQRRLAGWSDIWLHRNHPAELHSQQHSLVRRMRPVWRRHCSRLLVSRSLGLCYLVLCSRSRCDNLLLSPERAAKKVRQLCASTNSSCCHQQQPRCEKQNLIKLNVNVNCLRNSEFHFFHFLFCFQAVQQVSPYRSAQSISTTPEQNH